MIGVDAEHIAFAGLAQVALDIADAIDAIGRNPAERHASRKGALDHLGRKLRLGRKADVARHVCGLQASRIVGPALRQIQRAIDEGMAMTRHIGSKNTDLAVRNFARRSSILPRHPTRCLALFQKAGFIDHQHRIRVRKMLDGIVAHQIAQRIGIPRSRPKTACCRQGPGSPAASARIHPVLRRSSPSSPSTNRPAFKAARSCANSGRIRFFTSRSDDAHNSSVVSIDAPVIHDLRIMVTHDSEIKQMRQQKITTVMLRRWEVSPASEDCAFLWQLLWEWSLIK